MLRKIADYKPPCNHSEHYPPNMIVLDPGIYEHTCPGCGKKSQFTVDGTYCTYDGGGTTYTSWCYTHDKPYPHSYPVYNG